MPELPGGTVTFLFTDIEGSTKRWEAHPQEMSAALSRHNDILATAIEEQGGYVFKTVGDAFCAAFGAPTLALAAALAAQKALYSEEWPPEIGQLSVRMALHTGVVDLQNGDYFGQPVNRVARLLSAGHGGQVLVSQPAYDLVRDHLPTGVSLQDLGEHRLKDLYRPERIFQLLAPGLPQQFPPLKTLDNRPNNLPPQPTPLIGREKELAQLEKLLERDDVRLVTMTGPGGTGKTRLALQAASDLIDSGICENGVFFVNLAPLTDQAPVVSSIAQALGVRETGAQPILDTLAEYLRDRKVLLLLDNFEHLVGAATVLPQSTLR